MKRRAMLTLAEVMHLDIESLEYRVNNEKEINSIDNYLAGLSSPKEYTGKKGAEISYKKRFEDMSLALTKYTGQDAKKMSVLSYYQAFDAMNKETKRQNKGKEKRGRRR